MPKPFDVNEYIASLNLSEEDKKAVAPIFAKPEVVAEIQRGWNSKAQGSELMNEVSAAKAAAAAEKAEADRIKAEAATELQKSKAWAEALTTYEGDVQTTVAERDALAADKASYEAYLESIGVEPSYALGGRQPVKPPVVQPPAAKEPPVQQPPAIDPEMLKNYLTTDQVRPAIGLLSNLPFELNKIQLKHARLYGKELPDAEMDSIQAAYLDPANTRSLTDIAAERLHFGEREKAMEEERITRLVEERSLELYTKRMSELNLPSAAIDSLTPASVESAVKFASKGFSENSKRANEGDSTQVSAEEMQAFLQVDQELAAAGIRPLNF